MAAQYPTAAGTDANLFIAGNNLSTSLSDNPLTIGATTVNVASTTGFPTVGYITIEAEAISYTGLTGTTFTGCTRGADGTTASAHATGLSVFHDVVAAHHNVLKDEIKAVEADLVAIMASITPVSAANTSTSALQRIAHIVSQIKNGFGLTNWYDTVAAMMPKAGGTFTGAITAGADNPMAGFKFTGLGAGSAAGHSIRFEQMKVIQVVGATTTSSTSSASSAFVSTALTATITPTSSSNKILVLVSGQGRSAVQSSRMIFTLDRSGTDVSGGAGLTNILNSAAASGEYPVSIKFLDSPATTSSRIYTVQFKSSDGASSLSFNNQASVASIILLEVAP